MKKNSIETALPRLARRLIVILILLILPANIGLQQYIEHQNQRESSEEVFAQLEQLIELNEKNLENEKIIFPRNVYKRQKWQLILRNIHLRSNLILRRSECLLKSWI